MNNKKLIGLIIFIIGVVFIFLANHFMVQAEVAVEQQTWWDNTKTFWNHLWDRMHGTEIPEVKKYTPKVKLFMFSGIGLLIIGLIMMIFCKNEKRFKFF